MHAILIRSLVAKFAKAPNKTAVVKKTERSATYKYKKNTIVITQILCGP